MPPLNERNPYLLVFNFFGLQDLHLAIEISIEAIFDVFHKIAHFILSPSKAFRFLFGGYSSHNNSGIENDGRVSEASVSTATLGENDSCPTERTTTFHGSLNTDARTCQDVITELGYEFKFADSILIHLSHICIYYLVF